MNTAPLEKLHFDLQSPRFPRQADFDNEADVFQWMLRYGDLPQLMKSIATMGYHDFEPLSVIREQGKLIVADGNRRLAALKLLHHPELTAGFRDKTIAGIAENARHKNITSIPVIEFLSRKELFLSMGFQHITGVKPWFPYEKAKYFTTWYKTYKNDMPNSEIFHHLAEMTGTSPHYVLCLLETYSIIEQLTNSDEFFNTFYVPIENIRLNFPMLRSSLSYPEIRNYLGLKDEFSPTLNTSFPLSIDMNAAGNLVNWICNEKEKIIYGSLELEKLAAVIENPQALSLLEQGHPFSEIDTEISRQTLSL